VEGVDWMHLTHVCMRLFADVSYSLE